MIIPKLKFNPGKFWLSLCLTIQLILLMDLFLMLGGKQLSMKVFALILPPFGWFSILRPSLPGKCGRSPSWDSGVSLFYCR